MRTSRTVIFFLALFLSPMAVAKTSNICITRLTPLESFISMMEGGELMPQTDVRLQRRQLLIKNGGLCTSTCGINVIHALSKMVGRKFAEPPAYLELMLDYIRATEGIDGRKGLTFSQLQAGLRFITNGMHLPIRIRIERYRYTRQLRSADDEILLAMLVDEEPHVVVLTGQDVDGSESYFSDPHTPNLKLSAPTSMLKNYVKEVMRIRFSPGFPVLE